MGLQVNHPSRTPGAIVCGAHITVNTGARGGARSTYLGERVEAYDAPLVVDPVRAHGFSREIGSGPAARVRRTSGSSARGCR